MTTLGRPAKFVKNPNLSSLLRLWYGRKYEWLSTKEIIMEMKKQNFGERTIKRYLKNAKESRILDWKAIGKYRPNDPDSVVEEQIFSILEEIRESVRHRSHLFSLGSEYKKFLRDGKINVELIKAFQDNDYHISKDAEITKIDDKIWDLRDDDKRYFLKKLGNQLNIEGPSYKNSTMFSKNYYEWLTEMLILGCPKTYEEKILPIEEFIFNCLMKDFIELFDDLIQLRHNILLRKGIGVQLPFNKLLHNFIKRHMTGSLSLIEKKGYIMGIEKNEEFFRKFLYDSMGYGLGKIDGQLSDEEMLEFIKGSQTSLKNLKLPEVTKEEDLKKYEDWREKIENIIPMNHVAVILTLGRRWEKKIENGKEKLVLGLERKIELGE